MNVDESKMQRVCDFICTHKLYMSHWTCNEFYRFLNDKDCKSCCEKCKFFNPGDMMEWMKENHIWK